MLSSQRHSNRKLHFITNATRNDDPIGHCVIRAGPAKSHAGRLRFQPDSRRCVDRGITPRDPDLAHAGPYKVPADHCENQPGDARGDDRHDTLARELLHEQISAAGLRRLQRQRPGSPQLIVERGSARLVSPIPKFANPRGTLACELRVRGTRASLQSLVGADGDLV